MSSSLSPTVSGHYGFRNTLYCRNVLRQAETSVKSGRFGDAMDLIGTALRGSNSEFDELAFRNGAAAVVHHWKVNDQWMSGESTEVPHHARSAH